MNIKTSSTENAVCNVAEPLGKIANNNLGNKETINQHGKKDKASYETKKTYQIVTVETKMEMISKKKMMKQTTVMMKTTMMMTTTTTTEMMFLKVVFQMQAPTTNKMKK